MKPRLANDIDAKMPNLLHAFWDAAGAVLTDGNPTQPLGTERDKQARKASSRGVE
jgi:hypothetical protein